ncbi:MOSC domain-containing protein [Ectobacillus panaciterrae]|uniref:MOSC domain-containing protein n=1 Tax=Ectobacillus panaciterrae TaxID=363872 RepID=UPI000424F667|nr:MOSC domain-containing protein [Ectobacillus panaciterrae]
MSTIQLVYLSVGKPKVMKYGSGQEMTTGICKEAVEEVFLSKAGFHGDDVAHKQFHGGPDRAVCIYSHEHYTLWENEFGVQFPDAALGENLTVTHMLEKDVCIGNTYQVGEAIIQVTQGRIPCNTISRRVGIPEILGKIVETGYTGYLCRVLKEGYVRKDSPITLLARHPKQVSVLFANEVYFQRPKDADGIRRILEVEELADVWREKLEGRLEN